MRRLTAAIALAGLVAAPAPARAGGRILSFKDADGVIHVVDEASPEYAAMVARRSPAKGRIVSLPQYHLIEIDDRITPAQANVRWNRSGRDYDPHVRGAAERYGIPAALIKAVMAAESAFNPMAVSRKGAQGLMQLMPATARELQISDAFDPAQNIDGGARYLRQLWTQYDGDLHRTLSAYNAGPEAVRRAGGRIPNIPETRDYVKRVMALYNAYIGST